MSEDKKIDVFHCSYRKELMVNDDIPQKVTVPKGEPTLIDLPELLNSVRIIEVYKMELKRISIINKYNISSIDKISYGWSKDDKYRLMDGKGTQYLLRLSGKKYMDEKLRESRIVRKINGLDFSMSRLVEAGYSPELDKVYMLFSWLDGQMMNKCIKLFDENHQFRLGIRAGIILSAIHQIPIDPQDLPKKNVVEKKKAQMEEYISCTHRVENDSHVIKYVMDNLHLLENSKAVYKHGDFHLGNLILLKSEDDIGVIDFDRVGCGEGYSEFYKMQAFEVEISIPYSIGKVYGYFNGDPPELFWKILKLSVLHSSLYSIKWAEEYGNREIQGMVKRYEMASNDYDGFQSLIPKWYSENCRRFFESSSFYVS